MRALAVTGAGFLLAVLWFDLMFDVQSWNAGEPIPQGIQASISAYYRRVTTGARPMNSLVSIVMLLTLLALAGELVSHQEPLWLAGCSLVLVLCATGLAAARTVRNAVELGQEQGTAENLSVLARSILRDHIFCFAAIASVIAMQLAAG